MGDEAEFKQDLNIEIEIWTEKNMVLNQEELTRCVIKPEEMAVDFVLTKRNGV